MKIKTATAWIVEIYLFLAGMLLSTIAIILAMLINNAFIGLSAAAIMAFCTLGILFALSHWKTTRKEATTR